MFLLFLGWMYLYFEMAGKCGRTDSNQSRAAERRLPDYYLDMAPQLPKQAVWERIMLNARWLRSLGFAQPANIALRRLIAPGKALV